MEPTGFVVTYQPNDEAVNVLPVVIRSTVDPVLRETALLSLLIDLPGTGVLGQYLDPETGMLCRMFSDEHGSSRT